MQVNNPLNDISKKDNVVNIKEVVHSTPSNVPNIKKKESDPDEPVAACGLCCICYFILKLLAVQVI